MAASESASSLAMAQPVGMVSRPLWQPVAVEEANVWSKTAKDLPFTTTVEGKVAVTLPGQVPLRN